MTDAKTLDNAIRMYAEGFTDMLVARACLPEAFEQAPHLTASILHEQARNRYRSMSYEEKLTLFEKEVSL